MSVGKLSGCKSTHEGCKYNYQFLIYSLLLINIYYTYTNVYILILIKLKKYIKNAVNV